jgi:predicted enzyme related to lactoylglutathione lyase
LDFGRSADLCLYVTNSSPTPLVHLELHTGDLAGARALCAKLCGWRSEPIATSNSSYMSLDLASDLGGGIVECGTGRATWLPYVEVSRIDTATDLARRLGASVLLGPREGPAGWRSVISTAEAGEIALWQQKGWRL